MLHKPIPRERPQEALFHVHVPDENTKENKTGTFSIETACDLGIKSVWRWIVDRTGLIDSDRNADIGYKRISVARVSILDGKDEDK